MQTFQVTGMSCGHCEQAIRQALISLDAQAKVTIDRAQGVVQVESTQPREQLQHAIEEEGYQVAAA